MRDDKYFYPEIEDIFVGYECESTNNGEHWYKWEFEQHNFPALDLEILNNMYRTQYLTQEQIENEGWKHVGGKLLSEADQLYEKNNYILSYSYSSKKIVLLIQDPSKVENYYTEPTFRGTCRCINDFRKIIKLLNI